MFWMQRFGVGKQTGLGKRSSLGYKRTDSSSSQVPETKIHAVLTVAPRCPLLAPAGDRTPGETGCIGLPQDGCSQAPFMQAGHAAQAFTCNGTTRGCTEQNPTVFLQIHLTSLTWGEPVSKHHIIDQHPHVPFQGQDRESCIAALCKRPLRGLPRITCSVQARIKGF